MTAIREPRSATGTATASPRRRWCRGTRLVVAAATAWSAFLLAHLLLTGEVWWWSVAEMIPPIALALPPVVLAVGALWAVRGVRWRVELIAAASAVIVAPMLGLNPAGLIEEGGEDSRAALSVLAWNTDYWHTEGEETPEAFYDYLLDQDTDVYLLQEYLTRTDRVVPVDDEEALREHFEGWHLAVTSELVTVSRYPILDQRALDTTDLIGPDDPGAPIEDDWEDYWTTKILRTDIDVDGRTVSLYNVHLSVPVPTSGTHPASGDFWEYVQAQYQRRAAQVEVLIDDLAANPHPVLVAGDFNSTALSGAVASMNDLLECPDPDGEFFPVSWPKLRFPLPELWRLDWACTGGGAAVAEYRFVAPEGLSDHDAQRIGLNLEDR